MLTATQPPADQTGSSQPFSAFLEELRPSCSSLQSAISAATRIDEQQAVRQLLKMAQPAHASNPEIRHLAQGLVKAVRQQRSRAWGVDALMHEFSLSSEEGIALMCLAEALLRIPDAATANRLIADKVARGNWLRHLGESRSLFVNAAAWGLLITGRLVKVGNEPGLMTALTRVISKGGEPFIRLAMDYAMKMMGRQFVCGETIIQALDNSRAREALGYSHSYDMLGEAAVTAEDAAAYYADYENAIHAIGAAAGGRGIHKGPGISVKLSALHPRYARAQRGRVLQELLPRLKQLLLLAKQYDIGLNIDAEEADRLELSLELIEHLAFDPQLSGFDGLGIVVQAYQKRCPLVIDYLVDLARRSARKFMVRLVKGAYWDAEIKRAQVEGLSGYPVFTRKPYTDISYLVCAQKLLSAGDCIYPQFATHNAHTLSTIYHWAKDRGIENYEFQCLYGMGEALYDQVVGQDKLDRPCRIYAPVGSHRTLLAYLVRRLLENGANTSFVNQIVDEQIPIEKLIADPFTTARELGGVPHPAIPLPDDLFGPVRRNSAGLDFSSEPVLQRLGSALQAMGKRSWQATPLLATGTGSGIPKTIHNPADRRDQVGQIIEADTSTIDAALEAAREAASYWQKIPAAERAAALMHAADLFEENRTELMALAVREAGKSWPNALGEVREAVDFLRYYAHQATVLPLAQPLGPVVCISPWNFPLAIFTGEISAALAAGNVVLAKPAEQTPLIAHRAVQLLHEAGIPRTALQFLPGTGETVGARLVADTRVRGVIFTGSTEVAQSINRTLARRAAAEQCDIPLIAETGGQNAMIVDSSALPEQVVQDVLASAFDSAGQRCSALRILCLQEDIADGMLRMLKGAMQELRVGNPDRLSTDVGPVIDGPARQGLLAHIEKFRPRARQLFQLPLGNEVLHGSFVPPTIIEIDSLSELTHEVFGPVLHVVRYRREQLPQLVDAINATGYGLTLGIHSRIGETIDFIVSRTRIGNIYVNRNMIGAVVGVQPFGGEGKSGTGPKAGGPLYLLRLLRNPPPLQLDGAEYCREPAYAASDDALAALLYWCASNGRASIALLAQGYQQETPLHKLLRLPGPTGESNTLHFAPRGRVLCAASTEQVLLLQLAAAFASGNVAAILEDTAAILPAGLPAVIRENIKLIQGIDEDTPIDAALADTAIAPVLRAKLATRAGALVAVVETKDMQAIPLWRLSVERAVCINTTASGGNASLMSLKE